MWENYPSGLRVLEMDANDPSLLTEVAWFDSYNTNDGVNFDGVWSVYPYYESDVVLIHDRQGGMFLVKLSPITIDFPEGLPGLVDPAGVVSSRCRYPISPVPRRPTARCCMSMSEMATDLWPTP